MELPGVGLSGRESDGTVELEGTPKDLREFAGILRSTIIVVVELGRCDEDPAPYKHRLRTITIEPGPDRVALSVLGDQLKVDGSADGREILAADFETLATGGPDFGHHIHIEYFSDHFYLREGSAPLVVVVNRGT